MTLTEIIVVFLKELLLKRLTKKLGEVDATTINPPNNKIAKIAITISEDLLKDFLYIILPIYQYDII